MSNPQPTDLEERANAAYVWRKKVQGDLIDALREGNITLETAEWWFKRFTLAYRREIETGAAAKAERAGEATT